LGLRFGDLATGAWRRLESAFSICFLLFDINAFLQGMKGVAERRVET
jgi:hypothetical protein